MEIPMLYSASSAELENSDSLIADLISRSQAGDDEAFGLLFEHHHRIVFKFIFAMLGGNEHSLAEELTQETFLIAYKGIGSLRGDAKLKTWLCAIAKNIVYKNYRTGRKEGKRSDEEVETLQLLDEKNEPPDRQFLSKELKKTIYIALEKLEEDKRVVFILKEFQNLSYKEIADITGHGVPKLKTDLHRAKNEMRSLLRPYVEVKNAL